MLLLIRENLCKLVAVRETIIALSYYVAPVLNYHLVSLE